MSGGSFNYLCHKELDDFFQNTEELQSMADSLSEAGAQDASVLTNSIVYQVNKTRAIVEPMMSDLYEVWHAMEWWRSGDYGDETFKEKLKEWREKK